MSGQSDEGGTGTFPYLERQRALLHNMLQVTREQRRCLIEGDLKGLEQTNRLLGALLESQEALHGELPDSDEPVDRHILDELRVLANELQRESRTNYLLACRGAEFTRFSLSLLAASPDTASAPSEAETAASSSRPHLMDRPA